MAKFRIIPKKKVKPQNNKPKAARRPPQPRGNGGLKTGLALSGCSKHYAAASWDPWNTPQGACVPSLDVLSTSKQKFVQRGGGVIGTGGFGFVTATTIGPTATANYTTVASATNAFNNVACMASATAWAGTSSSTYATGDTGVTTTTMANAGLSPSYEIGARAGSAQFRLVALGIRIMYSGTEMERGGNFILYSSPGNVDTEASVTYNIAAAAQRSRMEKVDNEWHYVTWFPQQPNETGFTALPYYSGYAATEQAPLVCFVQGTAAQPFKYEIAWHWEVLQRGNTLATASHSDPVGFSAIIEKRSEAYTKNVHLTAPQAINSVAKSGAAHLSQATDAVNSMVGAGKAAYGLYEAMGAGMSMLMI